VTLFRDYLPDNCNARIAQGAAPHNLADDLGIDTADLEEGDIERQDWQGCVPET